MILHDYLRRHLDATVMIDLSIDEKESFQYNYWNWFHTQGELHLLRDDMTIGHIIHPGSVTENDDGSLSFTSSFFPKKCRINFYFGGVIP